MGFETPNLRNDARKVYGILTLSLWDLKPGKVRDELDRLADFNFVPMGFET